MERWKKRRLTELEKPYGGESDGVADFALAFFV
jgi:hypothetical protein